MESKTLRIVTLGIGGLMLTLTLSLNLLSPYTSHIIRTMGDSPVGIIQSKHIIHIDMDSPVGMIQSKRIVHIDMDSPVG